MRYLPLFFATPQPSSLIDSLTHPLPRSLHSSLAPSLAPSLIPSLAYSLVLVVSLTLFFHSPGARVRAGGPQAELRVRALRQPDDRHCGMQNQVSRYFPGRQAGRRAGRRAGRQAGRLIIWRTTHLLNFLAISQVWEIPTGNSPLLDSLAAFTISLSSISACMLFFPDLCPSVCPSPPSLQCVGGR